MDTMIPLEHALILAAALFTVGLVGLVLRRNVLFMLMAVEIMLNAAGLGFVIGGARWAQSDGQVMFLFILTLAAAEVSVGLGLVLLLNRQEGTLDADSASRMQG